MRSKLIITGAIGVLAAATLTVNAQTSAQKASTGSVKALLAASTHVIKADRDELAIATRVAATATVAASVKPVDAEKTEAKPATPKPAISSGCQTAIAALKSLHQADVAEDLGEHGDAAADRATAAASETSEDTSEVQQWSGALTTARTACMPQATTACQSAIAGLQPVLLSLKAEEVNAQQTSSLELGDVLAVRTAFSAVATACERPE
ncbi:MAG TPA: hypothetical protein VHW91_07725 [Candidatus Dormibacteraeota bacterium]|nr:hypothetical protein [Candidatus Dormibacteraeota bacterium]